MGNAAKTHGHCIASVGQGECSRYSKSSVRSFPGLASSAGPLSRLIEFANIMEKDWWVGEAWKRGSHRHEIASRPSSLQMLEGGW